MTNESYILALGIDAGDLPLGESAELASRVRTCGDVYRALARIGQDLAICGVVVNVDRMTPDQMEFFLLIPRVRGGLNVYVTSSVDSVSHRTREAIALGATGELNTAAVESLLKACEVRDASQVETTGACEKKPSRTVQPAVVKATTTSDDSGEEAAQLVEPVEDDATPSGREDEVDGVADETNDEDAQSTSDVAETDPARVPWLRYSDTPARKAPSSSARREPHHREPPADSPAPDASSRPQQDTYEPLLTDEELSALLDDSSMARGSDDQNLRSDDEETGGHR